MRKVEQSVARALSDTTRAHWRGNADEITHSTNSRGQISTLYRLHGALIFVGYQDARGGKIAVDINLWGWDTMLTRGRINLALREFNAGSLVRVNGRTFWDQPNGERLELSASDFHKFTFDRSSSHAE